MASNPSSLIPHLSSKIRSEGVRPLPPPSPWRGSLTSNPSSLIPHLSSNPIDLRSAINPKHPDEDADFVARRYYQVYERKQGFLPNLSILDLLFNMGPESVFWL
ncbi:MAG: WbqC family protein [Prevotella sp.]|nr:WbqC family protein [Prevotella sp.]